MVRKDTVQTTVIVNGKQGINELGKLEMTANELRQAIKKAKKGTDEYVAANKRLKEVKADIAKVRAELGTTGMTMQQLTRYQRELSNQIRNTTTRGTKEYKRLKTELIAVNAQLTKQRLEMRGMNTFWSKLSKEVRQFGVMALGYLGITTITAQLNNLINRSGDYSDTLAAVQKTTGLTAEETDRLNASLKTLNTRTARKELLAMAKVAGKLGITELNEVEGFVAAFDKINVALGEDLGNPEDVARKLGKLMEAFDIEEAYGVEQGLLKVGSAINHLGKSSTANEGFIVEFSRRLAGIAPLANLSLQDVMGLGATLDALGQTSEVSSTALNKLFIKMTQNKEQFAEYALSADGARISAKDFAHLIDTDFNEAFISLLRGVKDNANGMNELAVTLSDLDMDGGRVIGVLGTLANNTKLLYEQQRISNDEFTKGTSVLQEYNLMNETFGAKLDKIRKAIFAKFVNSGFVEFLERMANGLLSLLPPTETAADRLQQLNAEFNIEIQALMNGNLEREAKAQLIDEINEKYGRYLPNLISEKDTVTDLIDLQKQMNEQMIGRILMMQQEERMADVVERRANAIRMQIEAERLQAEFDKERLGGQTLTRAYIEQRQEEIDYYRKLANAELEASTDELVKAQEEFEQIMERFGNLFGGKRKGDSGISPSSKTGMTKSSSDSDTGGSSMVDIMSSEIDVWYEMNRLKAKQEREMQLITEEEYNRKETELKIAHLTALKEIYVAFGLDTVNLEQQISDAKFQIWKEEDAAARDRNEQRLAENRAYYQEMMQGIDMLASSVASSLGSMQQLISASTEQGVKEQLAYAQAQVIAARGTSLANAIVGATQAANATGPAAPFTLAGYIGVMVSTVLGAFADFQNNVRDAKSSINEINSNRTTGARGFYYGGETGYGMGKYGRDMYGNVAGYTHAGEFVEPAYIRHYPDVINAEGIMKARMAGYSLTGPVTPASTLREPQGDTGDKETAMMMKEAASMMYEMYSVLLEVGLDAKLSDDTIQKADERLKKWQRVKSKAQLRS